MDHVLALLKSFNLSAIIALTQTLAQTITANLTTTRALKISFAVLIPYVLLCRSLRYRRIRRMHKHFGFGPGGNRKLSEMTPREAQEIQQNFRLKEFPFTAELGMQIALISTYAVPGIAKVLYSTKQLRDPEFVPRRYADTAAIFTEFLELPPGHPRQLAAVARMNYLHGRYPSIPNHEFLYVLAAGCCKQVDYIDRLEWRKITDMEKHAQWLTWKTIGEEMHLTDIPGSYEEMHRFMDEYEGKHYARTKETVAVGRGTVELAGYFSLPFMKPFWENIMVAFMNDNLREAIGYPPPPKIISNFFFKVYFPLRKHYLRNFHFPKWHASKLVTDKPNAQGLYQLTPTMFAFEPWYIGSTWKTTLNPWNLIAIVMGWPRIGMKKYKPEGFTHERLGPVKFEGKGVEEFHAEVERLKESHGGLVAEDPKVKGMCPFSGGFRDHLKPA